MIYMLVAAFIIVIGTITYGFVEGFKEDMSGKSKLKKALRINLGVFVPIISAAIIFMIPNIVHAAGEASVGTAVGLGYIAAALCTGLATIGAGYAVGSVGSSALGAVSEDPKILGKTLIYVGLAEGIAIYGLIISIMILAKL
ncbi:V-type ATP synthase subunit K [Clostridium liquoris]|jgi:V/A-type H+-transporting ATPase subunit K|uniref:ATP synthase F(0) sector subunit c n=1 Tax=Clostridium liquoris TaxID=1289519 RepID=A0A2T0B049_9CLOT|nr:ATP synthase subunit C [Clostridium liquoris]PRR76892.1 V-type ATP synthase subunit K [Clostridium liquoris]